MIRRIDLAVVDDSNIVEMCKQYGDKYVVEPNVEAIKRWRSCYHGLSGSRRNIEKLRRLSDEVLLHFEANRQTNADCEIKMALMDELRKVIQNRARWNFKLLPFGSTMTGLATKQSDLDLIIWCPEANTFFSNEAEAACNILTNVRHFLATDPIHEQIEDVRYVEAEVPMVKIIFVKGPNINLSCCTGSYASGIQKSYLIRGFVLWDSRFASLYMLVKEWATCSGVENSNNGGFTSYTIVLMVIHFLQCSACPPILPNLQRLFPEKYARNVNGEIRYPMVLDFNDEEFLADSPVIEKNSLSVAQLFVLFLDYYCNFSFDRYYICMRDAAVKRRARSADDDEATDDRGSSVFIRDPIDEQNPGRSVRDVTVLQDKMRRTLHFITSMDHFPTLSEIFLKSLCEREAQPTSSWESNNLH